MARKNDTIYLQTPKFARRKWKITRNSMAGTEDHDDWGICCFDDQTINIVPGLSPLEFFTILYHEIQHALAGQEEEEFIARREQAVVEAIRITTLQYPELSDTQLFRDWLEEHAKPTTRKKK